MKTYNQFITEMTDSDELRDSRKEANDASKIADAGSDKNLHQKAIDKLHKAIDLHTKASKPMKAHIAEFKDMIKDHQKHVDTNESVNESQDHEFIKHELAKKDLDVVSIAPKAKAGYMNKEPKHVVSVRTGGDASELTKANNHIKSLGMDKDYVAVHASEKIGSNPSLPVKRAGDTHSRVGD